MTRDEIALMRQIIDELNRVKKRLGMLDTLEFAVGGGSYTNEDAQDAVGGILTDTATIDFTYADGTPSITADVKSDSITFAKLQNIATDSLIGRDTASSGDPENILLNATLEMDGSGNLRRAALTGDVTASAGSNTTAIGSNKVLTAMIADAQVTLAKMANLAQATIIGRAAAAGTGVPTALSAAQVVAIINSTLDHGTLAGLTDDDHTQYALLAGRSGGQTLKGGTASGDDLTLQSTNHATKGSIFLGTSAYDEVNNRLGLKVSDPAADLELVATATAASRGLMAGQYNSGAQGALFIFRKARNTRASPATVVTGDFAGVFFSDVHDGTGYIRSAGFGFQVNGTVATGSVPQDLILSVGLVDAGSLQNERVRVNSVGDVGVGTVGTTAAARMHVIEDTLGDPVQRLQSTATNDDPAEIVYQNRVATTNNTVTTLHTFTVPASTTYAVEVIVVARRTGGVSGTAEDGAHYVLRGVYQNAAGTATIIGSVVQTVVGESQAGWDATLDVTGATVRVRVTGATNNNITWHCTARVWAVGS